MASIPFQTDFQYRQLYRTVVCSHHEANALDLFGTDFLPLYDDVGQILEQSRP